MAHSHYVMDLYHRKEGKPDRPRHEVLRIVADGDEAAVAEGTRISGWRKPDTFQIRSITSSSRSGDKVIYLSTVTVPAPGPSEGDPTAVPLEAFDPRPLRAT